MKQIKHLKLLLLQTLFLSYSFSAFAYETEVNTSEGIGATLPIVLLVVAILGVLVFLGLKFLPIDLWYQTKTLSPEESWIYIFSVNREILQSVVPHLRKAREEGIEISFRELERFYSQGKSKDKILYYYRKAKAEGLNLSLEELRTLDAENIDIGEFINEMVTLRKEGIIISKEELKDLSRRGGIGNAIRTLIVFKSYGLSNSLRELENYKAVDKDVTPFIKAVKTNNDKKLGIEISILKDLYLSGINIERFVSTVDFVQKSSISISTEELIDMARQKKDTLVFAQVALDAKKKNIAFPYTAIKNHLLIGGNIKNVIDALLFARTLNIELDYNIACDIDNAGLDLQKTVIQSVHPKVINSEPIVAIAQNGIEIIFIARVTVLANLSQFVRGAKDDTIFARVYEAVIIEVGSYKNHFEVIENLNSISKKVVEKLTLTQLAQQLNQTSAYQILGVNFTDIQIGKDTLSKMKQIDAKNQAIQMQAIAQANLMNAEATLQNAIAVAVENGNLHLKDVQKNNVLNKNI